MRRKHFALWLCKNTERRMLVVLSLQLVTQPTTCVCVCVYESENE